ncbi:single-stranded DNA-binding protein [Actinopolyspora erythraea]|uniref:Single-stranded DNA-binding protein n=2 Tax=Actinopolyspora erythraea TaxID=414996 RepID=A0A223RPT5_9ACTN|nr:single-stranded DNA-binding protein [Actinopolyspora erythraea]
MVEGQELMYETAVTLVGEVLSAPRTRETKHGNRVASFRMVSIARRFDRVNQCWVDGDRVHATVNCWKQLAQGVSQALEKGDSVLVTGRLRTREYETDGQRRTAAEVDASAVGLDVLHDSRSEADGSETGGQPSEVASREYLRAVPPCASATENTSPHALGV